MPNGSSGNTGTETDWGGLIDDVGGLVDDLFDGDFWDWISQLGCLSSDFKLKDLKDRFPAAINAMRQKSGVDVAMTVENVNEFNKRLAHHYADLDPSGASNCRKKYNEKYREMLETYRTELHNVIQNAGFELAPVPIDLVTNYNQRDITVNGGYGFDGNRNFHTFIYRYSGSGNSGGDYTVIGNPTYESGGPFSPGTYVPTVNNVNVFNWVLGAGLAVMGFVYLKDAGVLKDLGFKKKRKY